MFCDAIFFHSHFLNSLSTDFFVWAVPQLFETINMAFVVPDVDQ